MKKTIGMISANYTNDSFGMLLNNRTLASLPFGGRYRLIDFPLSSMVNSGISTVGLITPYNYRSLIDHVGVGKAWSLGRKVGGLFLLPGSIYGVRSASSKFLQRDLILNKLFLEGDKADYVLFCGSSKIFNMDFRPLIKNHEDSNCPITIVYKTVPKGEQFNGLFLEISGEGMVSKIADSGKGFSNLYMDCFIINKDFLLKTLGWFNTLDYMDVTEILRENISKVDVNSYSFGGYVGDINTVDDYMKVSMDLLNWNVRSELFYNMNRPIFTKVQDEAPARYGEKSQVNNSLISTGCIIEGTVENSIIFRSCVIEKGAVVRNCILMRKCIVEKDARLDHVLCDKYATISQGTRMKSGRENPIIIGKNQNI